MFRRLICHRHLFMCQCFGQGRRENLHDFGRHVPTSLTNTFRYLPSTCPNTSGRHPPILPTLWATPPEVSLTPPTLLPRRGSRELERVGHTTVVGDTSRLNRKTADSVGRSVGRVGDGVGKDACNFGGVDSFALL